MSERAIPVIDLDDQMPPWTRYCPTHTLRDVIEMHPFYIRAVMMVGDLNISHEAYILLMDILNEKT